MILLTLEELFLLQCLPEKISEKKLNIPGVYVIIRGHNVAQDEAH